MKKDMVRATIYVEKQVWQEIRVCAHERWVSVGKYLTEVHNFHKGNKVHNQQVLEKTEKKPKEEKAAPTIPTGGGFFAPHPKER